MLRNYLPTDGTLPAGWKLSTVQGEQDSGTSLAAGAGAETGYFPICDELVEHGGLSAAIGTPAGYAGEVIDGALNEEVRVKVYSYPNDDASDIVSDLKKDQDCAGLSYYPNSTGDIAGVTVTVRPVEALGDAAVLVQIDHGAFVGEEFVVTQVGKRVLSLEEDNKSGEFPDIVSLAKAIAPQVK